jgi:sugar phosphate isomerase/epimerase
MRQLDEKASDCFPRSEAGAMTLSDDPPPLGLAHFTVLEVAPLDLVSLAARNGFAFIGLRLHPAFAGSPYYEIPCGSAEMCAMRRHLTSRGVRVHDVEFVTIAADFAAARLGPMLESAAELGARRLSVCGDDADRPRLIANFAGLCDLAASFGLGVDLEFMGWRQVASLPDAVEVVRAAARPNGGVLVDALHLARTGGSPEDLRDVPPDLIRSAQLCDAPAGRPASQEATVQEARAGRLPPGCGELPLCELLAELPPDTAISVEVPMAAAGPADARARRIHAATQQLFERCRRSTGGPS